MIPSLSRREALASVAALASLACGGCRLRSAALPSRTFLLSPPRPEPAPAPVGEPAGILQVRPFRVAPAFDSRAFVIRRGETEYATDAYHAFLLSPGTMFAEALAAWIDGWGLFRSVNGGGSQLAPSHALEGDVTELYGDYRQPARARAVLALRLRLLHPLVGARDTPLLWEHADRQVVDLPRAGADELVEGWNRALEALCRRLPPELFRRPPAGPGPRGVS